MRILSWLSRPSLFRALVERARLAVRLVREPVVPVLAKTLPVLAGLYVISPIDAVPDVLPVLGQLDDLTILVIALEAFISWCPAAAVDFHRAGIASRRRYNPMPAAGPVIDAELRRDKS